MSATTRNPNPSSEATRQDGHDRRGRFAAGNPGGKGNPYAKQTAAFRKALFAIITEDAMAEIAQTLLDMALEGNLSAIRLLLSYVIGRPGAAVEPDTVEEPQEPARSEGPAPVEASKSTTPTASTEKKVEPAPAPAVPPAAPSNPTPPAEAQGGAAPSTNGDNGDPPVAAPPINMFPPASAWPVQITEGLPRWAYRRWPR